MDSCNQSSYHHKYCKYNRRKGNLELTNKITGTYGKKDFNKWLIYEAEQRKLLYKKGSTLLTLNGLQLSETAKADPFAGILSRSNGDVNN